MRPAVLVLRGVTDERPRAVESLAAAVARRTSIAVDVAPAPRIGPTDVALFDHPLAFLGGSSDFPPLADSEVDRLRAWLTSGGMLVVDDRSPPGEGPSPFVQRAEAELSRVLGGRPAEPLRDDHAIFRSFYLLDRAWGRTDRDARLRGILVGQRVAVLFSPNDAMGAWERDELGEWAREVEPGGTRQREMALRLGVNVVLYALTLDYKEDLVHLPAILERRR